MDGVAGRRKIAKGKKGSGEKVGGGNLSQKDLTQSHRPSAKDGDSASDSATLANQSAKVETPPSVSAKGGSPKNEFLAVGSAAGSD